MIYQISPNKTSFGHFSNKIICIFNFSMLF